MCGICANIFLGEREASETYRKRFIEDQKNCLKRRGPDCFHSVSCEHKGKVHMVFYGAVLHLRGSLIKQPVTDHKNILLWNGEIFGGSLIDLGTESDTVVLFRKLSNSVSPCKILHIMSNIEGPYAFIFYQDNGLLWFGRDVFGRRSLLINSENYVFQICSTACKTAKTMWQEVPTSGIFCLDLNLVFSENQFILHHYPWSCSASGRSSPDCLNIKNIQVVHHSDLCLKLPIRQAFNQTLPSDCSQPFRIFSALHCDQCTHIELFQKILALDFFGHAVREFEKILCEAVKKRVKFELGLCKMCYLKTLHGKDPVICHHASVGILYSGGLDSLVIACLADRYVPQSKPIDLLNVAFCNLSSSNEEQSDILFDTPDRITGKSGLAVLKKLNPNRQWNFIEANISKEELVSKRQVSIQHLLYPSCTVLDDSIGCALWFAACGKGVLFEMKKLYDSQVRVLLVGMGADEQLAGYSRHRGKFKLCGWDGLINELCLELDRIGSRNLGRDDRVISDHGVESRYPFLDESVVSFLNGLPVWFKADLRFPKGVGEKLLLRLLAFKLGLGEAAFLPKRALQFGSRIAKLENARAKGSDPCERL